MGYVVDFIGLVYFHKLRRGSVLALLPDGRDPSPLKVEPHIASLFIHKEDMKSADWWYATPKPELEEREIIEFPILYPSRVTITSVEPAANSGCWPFGSSGLGTGDHDGRLPQLKKQDKRLKIVPEKARTIVQLPLHRGKLEGRLFGTAVMTRLEVPEDMDLVVITAQTSDGSATKTLTLANETEIVLSNTSDLLKKIKDKETHFKLYGRLDVKQRTDRLREPDEDLTPPPLGSAHRYLDLIDGEGATPDPGCSNGCC